MTISEALKVLDLQPPVSTADLKRAYREALMVWHPDRFTGNEPLKAKAEARTCAINEAYAVLSAKVPAESRYTEEQHQRQPDKKYSETPQSPPPCKAPAQPQRVRQNVIEAAVGALTGTWRILRQPLVLHVGGAALLLATLTLKCSDSPRGDAHRGTHTEAQRLFEMAEALPHDEAFELYKKAAEQGHVEAQYEYGKSIVTAEHLPQGIDRLTGADWLRKAAETGHVKARIALANALFTPNLLGSDLSSLEDGAMLSRDTAMEWLRRAAEQGDPEALLLLARHYATGAAQSDKVLAFILLEMALLQCSEEDETPLVLEGKGHEILRQTLAETLTKDELREARWLQSEVFARAFEELPISWAIAERKKTTAAEVTKNEPKAEEQVQEAKENTPKPAAAKAAEADAVKDTSRIIEAVPARETKPALQTDRIALPPIFRQSAQPTLPAPAPSAVGETLKWTDVEGRVIDAILVGLRGNDVLLKKEIDGATYTVPLARLSPGSREQAKAMAARMLEHLPTDKRLRSGLAVVDNLGNRDGLGKLTVDNGLVEDALVKLIRHERLAASFYVRGGEKFTFPNISDGSYRVIYCTGYGWSGKDTDFVRGRHAGQFDELLQFTTSVRHVRHWNLTLHKVTSGNAKTSGISLEEFDKYQ